MSPSLTWHLQLVLCVQCPWELTGSVLALYVGCLPHFGWLSLTSGQWPHGQDSGDQVVNVFSSFLSVLGLQWCPFVSEISEWKELRCWAEGDDTCKGPRDRNLEWRKTIPSMEVTETACSLWPGMFVNSERSGFGKVPGVRTEWRAANHWDMEMDPRIQHVGTSAMVHEQSH